MQTLNNSHVLKIINKILVWLTGFGLLVYFSVTASLMLYSRYIADDYCSAADASRLGLFRFVWYWFITWGGRLSAVSTDYLLVILGQKYVGLAPLIGLVIWIGINIGIAFHIIKRYRIGENNVLFYAIMAGAMIVYFLFQSLPNIPQTFFWFSAFRTHSLAVIIFNLFIWVYLSQREKNDQPVWAYVLALIFGLFNGLFSESFTMLQIIAVGAVIFLEYFIEHRTERRTTFLLLGFFLLGAVFAFAIMFLSPGTQNREEFFTQQRTILGILNISLNGFGVFCRSIFKGIYRSLAIFAITLVVFLVGLINPRRYKGHWLYAGFFMLFGVSMIFLSMVPAAYGMGDFLPRRAFPIPIFFGFIPILAAVYLAGQYFRPVKHPLLLDGVFCVLLACLLVSIIGNTFAIADHKFELA